MRELQILPARGSSSLPSHPSHHGVSLDSAARSRARPPPRDQLHTHTTPKAQNGHSEPISDGPGTSRTQVCRDDVQNNPVFKELQSLYVTQLHHGTEFLQEPFTLIYLLDHLRVKLVRDTKKDEKCCLFLFKHGASAAHAHREVQRLCVGGGPAPRLTPSKKGPSKHICEEKQKPPYCFYGHPVPLN